MLDDIAPHDPGGAHNETLHPGQLTAAALSEASNNAIRVSILVHLPCAITLPLGHTQNEPQPVLAILLTTTRWPLRTVPSKQGAPEFSSRPDLAWDAGPAHEFTVPLCRPHHRDNHIPWATNRLGGQEGPLLPS